MKVTQYYTFYVAVEQDCAKAVEWYQKAANNGDKYAKKKLLELQKQ